ncbi:MAG: SDR family oxidoreductase [Chloroflexi bacterium]|nr:SDR family oxidoreductase [Chloroflexota bacterium]
MRCKDKVVIITGGGSGAGKAYALALAKEGAKVVVAGRRLSRLERTVQEIEADGGEALAVAADVTVREDVDRLVQATVERFGRIDCLVNNAAIYPSGDSGVLNQNEDKWMYVFDVSIDGKYRCAQAVARVMAKQGTGGSIINIGSVATILGFGSGAYTNVEGTILGMTRGMALELSPYKIRVNEVGMGSTHTEAQAELYGGDDAIETTWADLPLSRGGKTDDTVPLVIYFCSDESEYVTGESVTADGGCVYTFWPGGVDNVLAAYRAKPSSI